MGRAREPAHVDTDRRDERLGGRDSDAGNLIEAGHRPRERGDKLGPPRQKDTVAAPPSTRDSSAPARARIVLTRNLELFAMRGLVERFLAIGRQLLTSISCCWKRLALTILDTTAHGQRPDLSTSPVLHTPGGPRARRAHRPDSSERAASETDNSAGPAWTPATRSPPPTRGRTRCIPA